MTNENNIIATVVRDHHEELLKSWNAAQIESIDQRLDLITESELKQQSATFLAILREATEEMDANGRVPTDRWQEMRQMLKQIAEERAAQGFTPTETATFIFSLKRLLFRRLRREIDDSDVLVEAIWQASKILDRLGLYATDVFLQSRAETIQRQQQELIELSTPVVSLWAGIVAVPLIGTLDSARTQIVMESLLDKIVQTGAETAIIDITGVPVVDTLVAQHLLKTVAAARLMGAECIISGIRPQIAQTIVHLGVDLSNVITKADLRSAFALALQRNNYRIVPAE